MIDKGTWQDHIDWQVDGVDQIYGNVDVKIY